MSQARREHKRVRTTSREHSPENTAADLAPAARLILSTYGKGARLSDNVDAVLVLDLSASPPRWVGPGTSPPGTGRRLTREVQCLLFNVHVSRKHMLLGQIQRLKGAVKRFGSGQNKAPSKKHLGTSAEWETCPGDKWKGLTPDSCTKGRGTFTPDRAGPPWTPDGTVDVTSVGSRLSRGTCHILLSHGYESVCQRAAERSQGNASRLYEEAIRSLAHRPWRGSGGGPAGCEASAGPASSPAAAPTPTPEE